MTTKLVKLAENPLNLSEDDDSMDYSKEADDSMDEELDKGKKVSGPRTKLSNSNDELATLRQSVSDLAKGVRAIANSQATLLKHMEMGAAPMAPAPAPEE